MLAQFQLAYEYLKMLEGHSKNLGYANRGNDLGGETIGGRTRKWKAIRGRRPTDLEIWNIVDDLKKDSSFPKNLHEHSALAFLIAQAYEQDEWADIRGGIIPSQAVADEVFEFAVHKTASKSVEILQHCMNKLNYNGTTFKDIDEDGSMGLVETVPALEILLERSGDLDILLKMFNCEQGHYYNERFTDDPDQEVNARGFYRRIEIAKS